MGIKLEILPPICNLCLCQCSRIKNAVAFGTVVFMMACFALVTQLGVRIHAREILVDLWSWQRVMILLSLLVLSVMPTVNADRKETQESTPKSPSTWTGLRQTWAKIQTFMYIHSCCVVNLLYGNKAMV